MNKSDQLLIVIESFLKKRQHKCLMWSKGSAGRGDWTPMEAASVPSSERRICRGLAYRQRARHHRPARCNSLGCHHHQNQVVTFFYATSFHAHPFRAALHLTCNSLEFLKIILKISLLLYFF